jgi:hypothetical protein
MGIKLGNTEASLYLGSTPVAAYLGAVQVAARTLYFFQNGSNDWDDLANWFLDEAGTQPSGEVAGPNNDVVIKESVEAGVGPFVVRNLTNRGDGSQVNVAVPITVTGLATFTQSAYVQATITGNSTFSDSSANDGTVTGNATFNDNSINFGTVTGTATFNDSACNDGGTAGTFVPDPPPSC